ncbi:hypothetical protein FRB94_013834 [Tulasnella sp. JGI-2019a]|nr:hypothetical protein FRB94_013834 [Tulasnella sp. JGI-2019a]
MHSAWVRHKSLISVSLLLPQEDQELKQTIFILQLNELNLQRTILAKNPEQKRFIFDIEHLDIWYSDLTSFLMRIQNALALANVVGPSQASIQQQFQLLQ